MPERLSEQTEGGPRCLVARPAILGAATLLFALSAAYFVRGLRSVYDGPIHSDLLLRHDWVRLTLAGRTPWDAGVPITADPPTSFFANLIEFGSPRPMTRQVYVALFLCASAVTAGWALRIGRPWGTAYGALLTAAFTATASLCTTLSNGQNALFSLAFVVAAIVLDRRQWFIASGVCLGLALAKPQIAALFTVPFLMKGRYRTLFAAASFCLSSYVAMCLTVRLGPITVFHRYSDYVRSVHQWPGYGAMQWLQSAGVPATRAVSITALTFGSLVTVYSFFRRRDDMLVLAAVASVAGRLWAYHIHYDNLMLVPLLILLGRHALRHGTIKRATPFLSIGVTLWAPAKTCDLLWFEVVQTTLWLGGAVYASTLSGEFDSEPSAEKPRHAIESL